MSQHEPAGIETQSPPRWNATQLRPTLDPGLEGAILSHTEGDRLYIHLDSGDSVKGDVTGDEQTGAGTFFDTPARFRVEFESDGTTFLLTMWYRESDGGEPEAEALDLRVVGADWSIPIGADIVWVR